jgi:hypothetical protein
MTATGTLDRQTIHDAPWEKNATDDHTILAESTVSAADN